MRKTTLRVSALVGAILTVGATLSAPVAANAAGGDYYPSGPQVNVPLSTVTGGGWTLCWSQPYGDTGTNINDVWAGTAAGSVSACDGQNLLLTGWANSDPSVLPVLAAAPTVDVRTETADNSPRLVNGTYWYFTPDQSIGYSPNSSISQNSCDVAGWGDGSTGQRLCWHLGRWGGPNDTQYTIQGGWSLGDARGLNEDSHHTRAIFKQQPSLHKGSKTRVATLGRALKIYAPTGRLTLSVSDASATSCRVEGNKLYAFAAGTCEVTVSSLKENGDVKASKSKTYLVN